MSKKNSTEPIPAPEGSATVDPEQVRIEVAIALHQLGAPIIALEGKRPREKRWTKVQAAGQTPETVTELARRGNIGMPTGAVSGRVVVDIDSEDHEAIKLDLGLKGVVTQEVVTGQLLCLIAPITLGDFRYIRSSRGSNSRNTGANTKDTMAISFSRMFSDGPEVSLNGSPTMSPSTAALCASVPFPP